MTYKVVLVDDHKIVVDGMRLFIEAIEGFKVVGFATTATDAKLRVDELLPDLLLLDNRLPDGDGVSLIDDADLVIKAISAGAQGYLTKNASEDYFRYILTNIMKDNETWLDPKLTTKFMRDVDRQMSRADNALTKEEKHLISLIAKGNSNKDIAELLFVSEHTIKKHLAKIYRKVGLNNRYDVAIYATKHDLIS